MKDIIRDLKEFAGDAAETVIKRAKAVGKLLSDDQIVINKPRKFVMNVPGSGNGVMYKTELVYYPRSFWVEGICSCQNAEENGEICKHQVAVSLKWLALLKNGGGKNGSNAPGKGRVVPMQAVVKSDSAKKFAGFDFPLSKIDFVQVQPYAPGFRINEGYVLMTDYQSEFEEIEEEKKITGVFRRKDKATVTYKDKHTLTVSCGCGRLKPDELCQHAMAVLLFISNHRSPFYFYRYDDQLEEKKALLSQFGLKPEDPLAKEFTYNIDHDGQLVIADHPAYLLRTGHSANLQKINEMLGKPKKVFAVDPGKVPLHSEAYDVGLLINLNNASKGGFTIEPLLVSDRKGRKSFKRMALHNDESLSNLFGLPEQIVSILKKITDQALLDILFPSGNHYVNHAGNPFALLQEKQYSIIRNRFYDTFLELKPYMPAVKNLFHLPEGQKFINTNIQPASISEFTPLLHFKLSKENNFLRLQCFVILNNILYPLQEFEIVHFCLRSRNEYFLSKKGDMSTIQVFKAGFIMIHESELSSFLQNVVMPLAEKYSFDFGDVIQSEIVESEPQGKVYLSELNESFLLIRLKWEYSGMEVEDWEEKQTIIQNGSVFYRILRRKEDEKLLIDTIKSLHPRFTYQANAYFYLNFTEALHKSWFLVFYNKLLELNIPVYGINELKKFKYNPNTPTFTLHNSSGNDWFDLTIEVTYGDIVVPLQELRKAIINKQNYILLGDGSLGMLPQEWIDKYATLMKMGELKQGKLKVSKFNWTVLHELQQQLNDTTLQQELEEKMRRLKMIGNSHAYPLPAKVNAVMRDYQVAGFEWMCLLDDMLWGGCLADDMGLGKTLQTITFLQHIVEKYPGETHLVICPTSLMYNWQTELDKFAPGLSYSIYYGLGREFNKDVFSGNNIIITSYGTVRNDLRHFCEYLFGYIILDESQTIKNPASQTAKAVQLLRARNRFVLSGTPVQNNTFDLYAQMQFLNPGMLGSQDFFKTEYAQPIDKNGDKEKMARLKQLIYPFLLRRTKEQVAGDLPDKTETVLWCEMNTEQRKIYNSFKEYYRQSIFNRIKGDGLGKSSIYILEGLTKLRQICDSPAILNEEEKYPNTSTKLEELIREIEENTGRHKALVFSQFVTMLKLVEETLISHGISYLYLDGSSSAMQRKQLVKQFQEDDGIRVFLISLKAGGVGLNLTSADYVYLVDPWWNPASEQQAIDRTHRIGQNKKVFAYKMICKDTVEEKILRLQEKKKGLADDLVSNEAGFVKKLTKEDVEYLFS